MIAGGAREQDYQFPTMEEGHEKDASEACVRCWCHTRGCHRTSPFGYSALFGNTRYHSVRNDKDCSDTTVLVPMVPIFPRREARQRRDERQNDTLRTCLPFGEAVHIPDGL
ncbi:unnamed protein product, partial [Ectocarpus sp. 8 AP-2014]